MPIGIQLGYVFKSDLADDLVASLALVHEFIATFDACRQAAHKTQAEDHTK